ncbi:MAG: aquaporin [Hyphomicrobium sp.]
MNPYTLNQRVVAEGLGTALLLATIVGSASWRSIWRAIALRLHCLAIRCPPGPCSIVLITMLGPVSGAHLNPSVTWSHAAK